MWKILLDRNGNKIGTKILNLKNTLLNGQSFNWKIVESSLEKINNSNNGIEYIGCIGKQVLLLKEDILVSDSNSFENTKDHSLSLNRENYDLSKNEKYIFYKFLEISEGDIKKHKTISSNKNKRNEKTVNKKTNNFEIKNQQKNSTILLSKSQSKDSLEKENLNLSSIPTTNSSLLNSNSYKVLSNYMNSECKIKEFDLVDEEFKKDQLLNNLILDYFQMEVDLDQILSDITPKLPANFKNVIQNLQGVRIIRQDVFECTISFICSSNNNIERIRKMLLSLRENYGEMILNDEKYGKIFVFPTLENLLEKTSEQKLRDLGFGYRAKYIIDSLNFIKEKGIDWLYDLEKLENPSIELINLTGVGRKVADCISLFSLKKHSIVPLDIHMIKFYNETVLKLNKNFKKIENLTKKVYEDVSKIYSTTFGEYAGWVHSIFYLNRVDKTKPDYLKNEEIGVKKNLNKYKNNKKLKENDSDPNINAIEEENKIINKRNGKKYKTDYFIDDEMNINKKLKKKK